MSENWLRLVATVPSWVPDRRAEARGLGALLALVPAARSVQSKVYDRVEALHCGGNWSGVACPACGTELEEWWTGETDRTWENHFADLSCTTPCCGLTTSLNDLDYHWPFAFGRWELVAKSPGRPELSAAEMAGVEAAVGHPLRQVWRRL